MCYHMQGYNREQTYHAMNAYDCADVVADAATCCQQRRKGVLVQPVRQVLQYSGTAVEQIVQSVHEKICATCRVWVLAFNKVPFN